MSHQYQLKKPLYRNWVKGGLAYKYLKDGIEEFADEAVNQEHARLLQHVKCNHRQVCSQCSLQTLKPKHGRLKDPITGKAQCPWSQIRCNCLFADKQACPENICDEILDEILRCHASTPPAPNWKNTNVNDWCSHPWEVAKCFINAPGYFGKKNVSDIDIAGLLHVFINNKMLHSHLACRINGNDVFQKTLRGRNKIFHSSSMELSQNDLIESADDMIALLEDDKELKAKLDSQNAVKNLKQLKENDICITTHNEAEVFKEAMNSINKRTEELKELIHNAKLDIQSKSEEASNTLDEKTKQIVDEPLHSLREKYDQLCEKVKHLEIDNIGIKNDLSEIRKRLEEIERLEYARCQQQQNLEYITQKQELQGKLVTRYQKEEARTWVSPLMTRENNINIREVYVPPKMFIEVTSDRVSESNIQVRRVENYHQILCATEDEVNENSGQDPFGREPFPKCHGQLKNIYILGEVGTGKSALCKMVTHTWCDAVTGISSRESMNENESTNSNLYEMSRYQFLFYVPMCYIPRHIGDIQSMVKHSLYGKATDSFIEELFVRESERCLILIDGLDEWTPPASQCRFRRHATHGIPVSDNVLNATIITTSRPSAHGILNMKSTDYDKKIKLVGIDESEIQHMAQLYVKALDKGLDINDTTGDFIKKLQMSKVSHPEETPLLLQQLLWMYCKGGRIDRSVSDIYTNIVNIIFAWFEEKEPEQESMAALKHVPGDVKSLHLPESLSGLCRYAKNEPLVLMLGKLAFRTIASATPSLMFGYAILKECDIPDDTLSISLNLGLIVKENCADPTVEKTQFSFTHISFRDFFAAVYIVCHYRKSGITEMLPKSREAILRDLFKGNSAMENVLKLSNILTMICGLDPFLITPISEVIYNIVLNDGQRNEYNMSLEDGQNVESDLVAQTQKIQHIVSNMLSECHFPDSEDLPKISVCDIIIHNDTNLNLVRQIFPKSVQSLNIDRCCLNDEVIEVIARLNHIHTLAIKNEEHVRYDTETSPFLTKADSLIQLLIYNEDLSIDLSRHEDLQNVSLDRCKHLSISTVNTAFLKSCKIRGLVFPHDHFDLLSSSFARAVLLEDLTLADIKCDRSACKEHFIDLSRSEKLRAFTLGDCDFLAFNISSSGKLESCGLRGCRLSHAQCEELTTGLTQVLSLKNLEVSSLHCDDATCEGHALDLSAQQHLNTLCLQNCIQVGVVSVVSSEVKSCTIRHCTFSHEQCSTVSSLLTQSRSLRMLVLSHIKCSKSTCKSHKVDLFNHKELQSVQFMDTCIYPCRLNAATLKRFDQYTSETEISLPDGMKNSSALTEFKVEGLFANVLYTSQINSITTTFKRLERLELRRVDIEEASLAVSPDMEHLNYIDLWVVNMSKTTWCKFVDSLTKLKQCVNVRTSSMDLTSHRDNTIAAGYVKRNIANFEITLEPMFEFSFKLRR